MNIFSHKKIALALFSVASLAACSDSKMDEPVKPEPVPMEYTYRLTVLNNTNNQPLTPVAFVLHNGDYKAWQVGEPASDALEKLAESGDVTDFIKDTAILAGKAGEGIVMPGMMHTIEVTVNTRENLMYSAATMLANTNDAFSGLMQRDISMLEVGKSITMNAPVYDAGTEANTEKAGTLPGPVDNGEGYNKTRDDVNFVSRHGGIVSKDDGLTMSVLNQSHRFDNHVAKFTIERIK